MTHHPSKLSYSPSEPGRPALYPQIKKQILSHIRAAKLPHGSPLESEKELCKRLNASRSAVRRALAELNSEGYIVSKAGKGHYVNREPEAPNPAGVISVVLGMESPWSFRMDSHVSGIVAGIQHTLLGSRYRVVIESIGPEQRSPATIVRPRLSELCGLILVPLADQSVGQMLEAIPDSVHKVVIGRPSDHLDIPCVLTDQAGGIASAMRYLVGFGHRRIAMVHAAPYSWIVKEHSRSYREAVEAARLAYDPELEVHSLDQAHVEHALDALLDDSPDITALLIGGGVLLPRVLRMLQKRRLQVPRQMSVVSFDDTPASRESWPATTVVREPTEQLGQLAVRMLRQLLSGRRIQPMRMDLPTELIARESVAPAMEEAEAYEK